MGVNDIGKQENAVPRHVAIVMDGNGRWAVRRGLPRQAGHARGAETFRKIATACKNAGVSYLTVYALSSENLQKRPKAEITAIMGLLRKYLCESIESMERDGIRLRFVGDVSVLPRDILELVRQTDNISSRIDGMQANVCFNYGSRPEIVRAALKAHQALSEGRLDTLDEQAFAEFLDSAGLPDPDLVIRTGGELRLSNFLMWQSAYSELIFSDVLWPDFTPEHLLAAFEEYASRSRRFGA